MKTCANPRCNKPFTPKRKEQKFCHHKCSVNPQWGWGGGRFGGFKSSNLAERKYMKKVITTIVLVFSLVFARNAHAWVIGKGGSQTGFIEAVQQEGVLWQNYHIFIKSSNEASQADKYCILEENRDIAEQLRTASRKAQRVTVFYRRNFFILPMGRCDGDEITRFEVEVTK